MCSGWSRSVEGVEEGANVMGLIVNHLYESVCYIIILLLYYWGLAIKKLENITLVFTRPL